MHVDVVHSFSGEIDLTKLFFVFSEVVLQCIEKAFGVFRGHDNAVLLFCVGNSGQHTYEVKYEFAGGMGNDGQVRIAALCYGFRQFNVDLFLGVLFQYRAV